MKQPTLEELGIHLGWDTRSASEVFNFACERERLLRIAQSELETYKSNAATAEGAIRERVLCLKLAAGLSPDPKEPAS